MTETVQDRGRRVAHDPLTELYVAHFAALVRLAALLLDEPAACEDVAQEAYIRVAASRTRLRDPEATLAYLQRTVVNLSRSAMRRRLVAARYLTRTQAPSAVPDGVEQLVAREAMVRAVRELPRRQREAVSLRYYADLTEAQAADVMGVSVGTVKSQTSRGLARLAEVLEGSR